MPDTPTYTTAKLTAESLAALHEDLTGQKPTPAETETIRAALAEMDATVSSVPSLADPVFGGRSSAMSPVLSTGSLRSTMWQRFEIRQGETL
jgi:hypothetical protein